VVIDGYDFFEFVGSPTEWDIIYNTVRVLMVVMIMMGHKLQSEQFVVPLLMNR